MPSAEVFTWTRRHEGIKRLPLIGAGRPPRNKSLTRDWAVHFSEFSSTTFFIHVVRYSDSEYLNNWYNVPSPIWPFSLKWIPIRINYHRVEIYRPAHLICMLVISCKQTYWGTYDCYSHDHEVLTVITSAAEIRSPGRQMRPMNPTGDWRSYHGCSVWRPMNYLCFAKNILEEKWIDNRCTDIKSMV